MVPELDQGFNAQTSRPVLQVIARQGRILPVRNVVRKISEGQTNPAILATLQKADPDNGLYAYLDLFVQLRRQAVTTQPSVNDDEILERLRALPASGTVHIYADLQRRIATEAFVAQGWPERSSAAWADQIRNAYRDLKERHRPVVRKLADLLIAKGDQWHKAGRVDDAKLAYSAVVRLLVDLVDDSPTPDVALLTAEKLPTALRRLGADAQADTVESLGPDWHQAVAHGLVNFIPWTGDFSLAKGVQEGLLRSFCVAVFCAATWVTLAVVCVLLLPMALLGQGPAESRFRWAFNGWGAWVSAAVVALPLVVFIAVIVSADIPFSWLLTLRSVGGVILLPALFVVVVLLARRLCSQPRERFANSDIPSSAIWVMFALLLLALIAAGVLLPVHAESWRPPVGIQLFRKLGFVFGAGCAVIAALWLIWGFFRGRSAHLPAGARACVNLGVAARALLVVSLIAMFFLGINYRMDGLHAKAFVKAAADPLADRLGETWQEDYFGSTCDFLAKLRQPY